MNAIEELLVRSKEIEEKIGYVFKDEKLFLLAFVHRSFFNEHRDLVDQHNERLEFLGDSVLGLIISDYLYTHLPKEPEGQLSHLRSQIVEAGRCVQFVHQLGIAQYVLLGRGERMNDGRGRDTILADLFEAMIGAIFLDGGLDEVKRFFFGHFSDEIAQLLSAPLRNWKAELQDYSQKKYQKPPMYKVLKEVGPDHSKMFYVVALIDEQQVGEGTGSSKKEAEQAAAENALKKLAEETHG
ncbi:MAG: ribonuclease III [Verrucomicrobia bacterium]|nr:ribonuclease III [Verrucomicrobiota bacterium]